MVDWYLSRPLPRHFICCSSDVVQFFFGRKNRQGPNREVWRGTTAWHDFQMKSQPRCRISVCFRLGQFFFDCLVCFKNILRAFYIPNAEEFRQKTFGKCVSHIRFIYRILQALTSFMFHYRMPCKAHEASIFCYRSIQIFHFSPALPSWYLQPAASSWRSDILPGWVS